MRKLMQKMIKRFGKRTLAVSLVIIMSLTMFLPGIVNAFNLTLWITHPSAYPTWFAEIENYGNAYFANKISQVKGAPSKSATGMAFNQNFFNGYLDAGFNWPLGAVMYLEPIDGKDNAEFKKFEFRHTFCTANHVNAYVLQHGARAFCSGVFNVEYIFDAADKGEPIFNFIILAIACAYPENYTINKNAESIAEDSAVTEDIVSQLIAWCATDDGAGFTGEWAHDYSLFHIHNGYYDKMMSSFAAANPNIHNTLHSLPEPNTGAWSAGDVSNYAEAMFYDIWTAAKLTSQLEPNWAENLTTIGSVTKEENGQYEAVVTLKNVPEAAADYLYDIPFKGYGDWKMKSVLTEQTDTSPNILDVSWTISSATGKLDENGFIGSFEYGNNDVRNFMPTDMTKARIYTFDTYNLNSPSGGDFGKTQTQFASVIDKGLSVYVKYGETTSTHVDMNVDVHRYKHTENWKANYNVNLYKLDSETGKPISGSRWDVLEKFDDSQLDNTDLDRTADNPGGFDVETGSLVDTEWGDDEVSSNYSGNMGVLNADANKYNWANDKKRQFETWDDPEKDPCTRDDNVTKEDGKLYEVDSSGSATSDVAHTDTKNYTYTKGYCGGHPAPEIEYEELTGDNGRARLYFTWSSYRRYTDRVENGYKLAV